MYSEFNEIEIDLNAFPMRLSVTDKDGATLNFLVDDPAFKEFKLGEFRTQDNDYILITNKWIQIYNDAIDKSMMPDLVTEFYASPEFRKCVRKQNAKDRPFSLNYCKHLRGICSRKHMNIEFMPGWFVWYANFMKPGENTWNARKLQVKRMIHTVYAAAKFWSEGQEDKPLVVIAPESEESLGYIIWKNGILRERGVVV